MSAEGRGHLTMMCREGCARQRSLCVGELSLRWTCHVQGALWLAHVEQRIREGILKSELTDKTEPEKGKVGGQEWSDPSWR